MVRALRPHRRFSPPTLQSEFVILHRAKRHPAIGHDFLDAKAERGGGSSLAYDPISATAQLSHRPNEHVSRSWRRPPNAVTILTCARLLGHS